MPHFHTIEDNYDYRVRQILQKLQNSFRENIDESGLSFEDWLWANHDELGKAFYEDIDQYEGIEAVLEDIDYL